MERIIICNWKTYLKTDNEAIALAEAIMPQLGTIVVVCPSSLHISAVAPTAQRKNIGLGAQDISVSARAPQTGRLSGRRLFSAGVRYVLVGHAETRAAGVTNKIVAEKAAHAITSDITPVVCLSEQKPEQRGQPGDEVNQQLKEILGILQKKFKSIQKIIVAYEPTANIGSDSALKPAAIQQVAKKLYHTCLCSGALDIPVLYGGAARKKNAASIMRCTDIHGLLLGRAGTDAEAVNALLKI